MPSRSRTWVVASLSALTLASTSVHAHGNLVRPQPTFSGYGDEYLSVIQTAKLKAGQSFVGAPDTNAASFDAAFKGKSSLKDFILANQDLSGGSTKGGSAACGFSNPSGTSQALPASIQWAGGNFIHPGPCETWCDGEIVVPYTANCWKTFADGSVPYTKAKCTGKKQLTFYWLAVHVNCVPLSGGASVAAEAASGGNAATGVTASNANANKSGATSNTGGGNTGTTNNNKAITAPSNSNNVGATNNNNNNKNNKNNKNNNRVTTALNNNGNRNSNSNIGAATDTNGGNNSGYMGFGLLNNNNNNNSGGNAGVAKKNLR